MSSVNLPLISAIQKTRGATLFTLNIEVSDKLYICVLSGRLNRYIVILNCPYLELNCSENCIIFGRWFVLQ